jgi:hypothetical protein
VFDLVDYVAQTGVSAGGSAARYAAGISRKNGRSVEIVPGRNVRMLFPQRYSFEDDLILFIRAAEPVEDTVRVVVSPPGLRFKRPYARPNEMIRVKVAKEKLQDVTAPIEVNITEG